MKTRQLEFSQTVKSTPAEAYRAFTHPTALRDWMCNDAHLLARPGGHLYLLWDDGVYVVGQFIQAIPGQTLAISCHNSSDPEPLNTHVLIQFVQDGDGTSVRLVHSAIPGDPAWDETFNNYSKGWESMLENLQSMLETGLDLRQARRPMMGIFMGEYSPEVAARLGIPVSQGVRLDGTMEGLSARAIGLVSNDVIVALDGVPIANPDDLSPIIRAHRAGDRLPVEFYRGAEKLSAVLELAPRPKQEFPTTVNDLVAKIEKDAAKLHQDLEQLLAGCTEVAADRRTGPAEWNIKEILAHLIAEERDHQPWFSDMLNDYPVIPDSLEYSPNVFQRLQALVAVYPTLPDLLAELRRSQVETAGLIAHFPETFVARKHLFNRVSQWMAAMPNHYDEHLEQIKSLLSA